MATDWFKMGVGFYRDPALVRAGEAAEIFFVRALGYCAENDTKGFIPKVAISLICPADPQARVDRLVAEKVLIERKEDYKVRSWGKWQQELDDLFERRRKDRERKQRERDEAKMSDGTSVDESEDSPRNSSGKDPDNDPDNDPDSPRIPSLSLDGDGDGEKSLQTSEVTPITKSKRGTRLPNPFGISDEMRDWCIDRGISESQARSSHATFCRYWWSKAKDNTKLDWFMTWQNWLTKDYPNAGQRESPGKALLREMGVYES